jgi:hypothetical protein
VVLRVTKGPLPWRIYHSEEYFARGQVGLVISLFSYGCGLVFSTHIISKRFFMGFFKISMLEKIRLCPLVLQKALNYVFFSAKDEKMY